MHNNDHDELNRSRLMLQRLSIELLNRHSKVDVALLFSFTAQQLLLEHLGARGTAEMLLAQAADLDIRPGYLP